MFKLNPIARSLLAACGGAASLAVFSGSALAQQQTAQQLERVEVTGSSIRRVQEEAAVPVTTITRQDIARTGATTINELLRSIPSVNIFDQGELASNSPSGSGSANVATRGLSSSNLLVLLNGRRLPVNALYDASGAGAAVDINMIPISAIERIEILKDGGSAIYGADAVAGVFNIITKRDYQGIEARAGFGVSSEGDGNEQSYGISGGFGDLNKDRFNVFLGLDYFKRDPIYRADRDISKSVDFRRFGGGDRRSSFAPQGNIVNPNTGAFVGQTYRDCPPANFNGVCRYDFNASLLTAYNGADRLSALGLATFAVTKDIRAFAEVIYSKSEDTFEAHPVPDFFVVPALNAGQGAFQIPGTVSAANPFGQIYIAGRFMQGGPRTTERESELINLATGLEGTSFNYDWKVSVSQGESQVTNKDSNYYDATKWVVATGTGLIDPTVNTNNQALVNSLKVTPVREGKSTLQTFNAQIGGDVMQLPAGTMQFAVGYQWLRDKLTDTPDPLTQQGLVVGSIQQSAVDASRIAQAFYGELAIPIVKNVDATLAVRYDNYPNESQTSPKAAIKWQALSGLAFRGSYTESFRAPVLKQLYGASEEGAATVTDPALCEILTGGPAGSGCPGGSLNVFQIGGSNANLKSETGKTYNLGVIAEAGVFSGTIDWWTIQKDDVITTPTFASAIRSGAFTKTGPRYDVFTNLQNKAEQKVSGIDFDFRLRFPGTIVGTFTLRNLLTTYNTNKTRDTASSEWAQFRGTYATPKWSNLLAGVSELGPWTTTVLIRSVGGFIDNDDPLSSIPAGTRTVGAYDETDVQVAYAGFKNLTLTGGIRNIFDRQPPFSNQNTSDNRYTQMGFAELYNNRGAFYYASVIYKFR
jgi:iron complex outermembrane recepter protein